MEPNNIEELKDRIRHRIGRLIDGTIDDLTDMWLQMFSADTTAENLVKLVDHAQSFLNDICEETVNRKDLIRQNIDQLTAEQRRLQQLLQCEPLPAATLDDQPLFNHQVLLDQQLQELRDQLAERQAHIRALCDREQALCQALCERPLGLIDEPLPSADDIEQFEFRLAELGCERDSRQQRVSELSGRIRQMCAAMEMELPRDVAGQLIRDIAAAGGKVPPVSAASVNRLAELERTLLGRQATIRQEIGELLAQLRRMYDLLEMSPRSRAVRMPAEARGDTDQRLQPNQQNNDLSSMQLSDADAVACGLSFTKTTVDCLRTEIERCRRIRRQNIQRLVEKVRRQIEQLWEQAMRSERERARFTHFTNDCYTEDLLYMHELELADLQQFCDENAELFAGIREHRTLWECLLALEAKEKEPGRYQNRGGQLLVEEKERRVIAKKLPKILANIERLEGEYNAANPTRPFTVWGLPVGQHIAELHADREAQRVQQSSARKATPRTGSAAALTAGTSSVQRSMMSASRTPMSASRTPMSVSRMPVAAGGGGATLKRMASTISINPVSTTKKARIHTVSSTGAGMTPNKPVKRNILSELAQGAAAAAKSALTTSSMRRPTAATPSKLTPHRFVRPQAVDGVAPARSGRPAAVVATLTVGGNRRRSRRKSHNKSTGKATSVPRIAVTDCSSSQADDSYVVFEERVNSKSRSSVLPVDLPTTSRGAGRTPGKMRRKSRTSLAVVASASRQRSPDSSSAAADLQF